MVEKLLVREECESFHGTEPCKRTIEELIEFGYVVVDKPKGPTSHQVSSWVKEIFEVDKAGHAGTLDPKVSGVLPVAISNGTKIINILHASVKEYVCLMRLHKSVEEDKLIKVFREFEGTIYQIPPLRSAVARRLRKRRVYELEIIEIDFPFVLFRAKVSAGTYMRTLCIDIGLALGVGAHMQELRRISTAHIGEDMCSTLQDIRDAYIFWKEEKDDTMLRKILRPADEIPSFLPKIFVKDNAVDALCHGAPLYVRGICHLSENIRKGSLVAVYTLKNELIGIGKALMNSEEMLERSEGEAAKLDRVLMKRGTYPRVWKTRKDTK